MLQVLGLHENNGAVLHVDITFLIIWPLVILALLHSWIGFCHGQILIETATHSLECHLKTPRNGPVRGDLSKMGTLSERT